MINESEKSFEELYKESLKDKKLEKVVKGKIISITSQGEIFVDIGYKSDGIIPKKEYSSDENADPKNEFKIGDEITADVLKQNDGFGNVLLSYKRAKIRENKNAIESKINNKEIFEEVVESVNDKGLIVKIGEIKVFIPVSLSGLQKGEKITSYKGKKVKFKIIEYEPRNNRIIGSIKSILDEEKQKNIEKFWEEIQVGKKYIGIVSSISSYGAFIDLGVVQGLLHVSELSWNRNIKTEDVLKQGEKVEVTIKELDKENKRIKLTYCNKGPNPWNKADEKYSIGDIIKVKVTKIMPFGVFVELEPGIEGLVHISQITDRKILKPEEELKQNQHVNAKIIDINIGQQRIELSIKELEATSNEYKEEM